MARDYIKEKTFDKIDPAQTPLAKGEYERCTFKNCDFSNADFGGSILMECEFDNCNLSLANLEIGRAHV
jgi:fluoroquinolone resistance protein